ncbi:MAG: tRNA pseudouridine synthase A [Syntrophus sp. SKADARSKE-3]|nr:tRNA pseudouridine synthase A [Syntrophus sp. SKADARSKE-3]
MRTLKMVIEFDGTNYRGWQRQKNGLSIQQVLEEKIAVLTGEDVKVIGSGRTDAGVHAMGQVAHFKTNSQMNRVNLHKGLNSLLPRDIAVKVLEDVDDSFHARIDVKTKIYLYRIYNGTTRSPLYRQYAWTIFQPLDRKAMTEAAKYLIGYHDFTSFSTVHTDVATFTRTIVDIGVMDGDGGFINIFVEADGFLRYMVRTIVGTLVEVGKGKRSPHDMPAILDARNRSMAGMTAPANGLFLKEVKY